MNFTPVGGSGTHEGFCLIKSAEKKLTAKGVPYLDLILADSSGEISAKLWDYKESPDNHYDNFDFVKVRGTYVPFNDTMQFRVERIRPVLPEDNVAIEDFVPSACLTGEIMLAEVEKSLIHSMMMNSRNSFLQLLKKTEKRFFIGPPQRIFIMR